MYVLTPEDRVRFTELCCYIHDTYYFKVVRNFPYVYHLQSEFPSMSSEQIAHEVKRLQILGEIP